MDNYHTVYVYDWRKSRELCSGRGQMGDPPQVSMQSLAQPCVARPCPACLCCEHPSGVQLYQPDSTDLFVVRRGASWSVS